MCGRTFYAQEAKLEIHGAVIVKDDAIRVQFVLI